MNQESLEDVWVTTEVKAPHTSGFVTVSETSLDLLPSSAHQCFPTLAVDRCPCGSLVGFGPDDDPYCSPACAELDDIERPRKATGVELVLTDERFFALPNARRQLLHSYPTRRVRGKRVLSLPFDVARDVLRASRSADT